MMNSMDGDLGVASVVNSRLSKQQKTMLQSLVDKHPILREGRITFDVTLKLWPKIANELNRVPGARKTWMQWRQTWRDIKKNSKKSQLICDSDEFTDHERSVSDAMVNNDDDSGDNAKIHAKRRRAKNMSGAQRKLLNSLVRSSSALQKDTFDEASSLCLKKRKEWQKIAVKLNSLTGPQKTSIQWRKCWYGIQKYYARPDATDSDNNDVDMTDTEAATPTRKLIDRNEMSDCTPSATQLNCLVKKLAAHRNDNNTNIWMSLSNTLNDLGPCAKNGRGWKSVWNDHKTKIRKLVAENGTRNLDSLQRLTYECIKRERNNKDSASSTSKGDQLQRLQHTAEQECNIVGSLVAVKLRSMQKEQKLIAEKLISEVLFQGQMEMFQYSDKAVNIPGFFELK